MESPVTSFVDNPAEYQRRVDAGESVIYAAAINLPREVDRYCDELESLRSELDEISVLVPWNAYFGLRSVRRKFLPRRLEYEQAIADVAHRMSEPVESASAIDLSWIQGAALAAGMSAYVRLNGSYSAVVNTIDFKAAYSLACFSLYISLLAMLPTVWELLH